MNGCYKYIKRATEDLGLEDLEYSSTTQYRSTRPIWVPIQSLRYQILLALRRRSGRESAGEPRMLQGQDEDTEHRLTDVVRGTIPSTQSHPCSSRASMWNLSQRSCNVTALVTDRPIPDLPRNDHVICREVFRPC